MNAAEFTALGVVLMKYRDAVDHVDASLMTAVLICDETDPAKAEHIGVARVALLDALMVVDGLLEGRQGKES